MFDVFGFADNLLNSRNANNQPNTPRGETANEYMNVIRSRDSRRGEEIANNILKTYGISKEQALQMAQQKFGIRF